MEIYMDLYRHGITRKLVEYAVKKYKSHRRIPHYVIQELNSKVTCDLHFKFRTIGDYR